MKIVRPREWAVACAASLSAAFSITAAAPPPESSGGDTNPEQVRESSLDPLEENRPGGDGETGGDRQETGGRAADDPQGDAGDRLLRAERIDQQADDDSTAGDDPGPRTDPRDVLPQDFERLGLTQREQAEVLRVVSQYDRQIEAVLGRFADLHREAVSVEGIALVPQRSRDEGAAATAAEDREGGSPGEQGRTRTAPLRSGDAAADDRPAEKAKEIGLGPATAGPAADIWKKLHELHLEAVKVEAQKLAAVEKLLSPAQLERLHGFRSEPRPDGGDAADGEDRPDRPDLQNAGQNAEEERRDREADRNAGAGGTEAESSRPGDSARGRPSPEND